MPKSKWTQAVQPFAHETDDVSVLSFETDGYLEIHADHPDLTERLDEAMRAGKMIQIVNINHAERPRTDWPLSKMPVTIDHEPLDGKPKPIATASFLIVSTMNATTDQNPIPQHLLDRFRLTIFESDEASLEGGTADVPKLEGPDEL